MGFVGYAKCDGPGCKRRGQTQAPSRHGRATHYYAPKGWYYIAADGQRAYCSERCHKAYFKKNPCPDY